MRLKRKYNHGGVHNGDPVKSSSSSFVGTSVASPQLAPQYWAPSLTRMNNEEQLRRIADALDRGEDVIFDQSLAPAVEEYRKFRKELENEPQTSPRYAEVSGVQYPMESGAVSSIAPIAEFLTPVGDVMAINEGVQTIGEGIVDMDLKKIGLGAGLSAAAVGMAFLPGNANMIRTWGESVDNRVIQDIVNTIDESRMARTDININDVMNPVFERYGRAEREAASDEISNLLDIADDPYSGFDLNSEEKKNLTDIMFALSEDVPPPNRPNPLMRFEDTSVESILPGEIAGFKKFESSNNGRRVISYEHPVTRDYIELTTSPLGANAPESWVQAYPYSYVNSMNIDMSIGKKSGDVKSRDIYSMMTKMIDQIPSGDIVSPGSLSTDSYPIFLRQLDKGNKYLTEGGKKQGTKILDRVPENEAINFQALNSMGEFTNFFKIPEEIVDRISTDKLLTNYGTSRAFIGPGGFESIEEANRLLMEVKEKYIDPELVKRGLPPSQVDEVDNYWNRSSPESGGGATPIVLRFPMPFVEKLLFGGKIKTIKKAKKGLKLKKR